MYYSLLQGESIEKRLMYFEATRIDDQLDVLEQTINEYPTDLDDFEKEWKVRTKLVNL